MTKSKVLSTLLAASLIFSATAGCNSKTKKTNNNNSTTQQEIRTYTGFFAAQIGSVDENNVVKNLIAEKIGARCEETWLDETGNRDNIISNMIIQNEYPDFIYPDAANYQKLLQAGALSPIDVYWDDYPNVKNYFSQAQWNRIREDDGHIYMIPVFSNCYMYDTNILHNDEAFWIQVKVLKWGGYPKITTLDEYFDLLERYVEANPIAEDGTPNIGYEILADPTIFFCLDNPPQFLAGYPNDGCCIVDPDTLEAVDYNLSDTAKRWFKKLNEEYKKGIIDPDCFVLNQDQYYDKIRTGNVLGMADQKWNFQRATYELPDECQYVPLGVVIDEGIEEHYHSQPAFDDSMGITISTSCDDVEGALKFLNDLLSPEILTLRFWGIEGKDYMVDDDGLFYCTDEQTANRSNSEYAYKNFKKNGYVFHAANSASIKMKMATGLRDNIATLQQQKELLYIEQIYRKYSPDTPYSPLGHAVADILENKTDWFFDGFPIHSMGYANSPQWFSYFCGKSYVYFDSIPEERRNGYANRDYRTSLEAIIWLIKDRKMSVEDAKKIVYFFKKCWVEYKDTIPCLMFVPVKDVGINDDIEMEQYLDDEGMELLFDDIILGKVNPGKNYCCKKSIQPEKLSCVDLSPILPRFIIGRENTNGSTDVLNQSNIQHGEDER